MPSANDGRLIEGVFTGNTGPIFRTIGGVYADGSTNITGITLVGNFAVGSTALLTKLNRLT